MQVGANHVVHARTLIRIGHVVALTLSDGSQRGAAGTQVSQARVVLKTNHGAELLRLLNNVANQAVIAADRVRIKNADTLQHLTLTGAEFLAEQLVQATNDEHRHASLSQRAQRVTVRVQVVLNHGLTGVLAAATQNDVNIFRERLTGVVVQNLHVKAVRLRATSQRQSVTPVAVNVHVERVQLQNTQSLTVIGAGGGGALKSVSCRH